ncbi:MAG: CheR family methyltransferase [Candidatus Zixiibacteriota bacterium]
MPTKIFKRLLKSVPFAGRIWNAHATRVLRFKILLLLGKRESQTFTRFYRLPTQFKVLAGPVINFLLEDSPEQEIRILVIGCSKGAEAYTISAALQKYRPGTKFSIHGVDIDPYMITRAEAARYHADELGIYPRDHKDAVASLFVEERSEESVYDIKPEVRRHVTFSVGNALDPNLAATCGPADIVFAQNFLYHLKPADSKLAFFNLCSLLKPRAALFIDGMDLDMKQRLTRQVGLTPMLDEIETIHADAYEERGTSWPAIYWGLEPLSRSRKDWTYRYSTIFTRNQTVGEISSR